MKKKPRGRPETGRIARNVYLESKHLEALREFGGGNVSAAIRILTERHLLRRKQKS